MPTAMCGRDLRNEVCGGGGGGGKKRQGAKLDGRTLGSDHQQYRSNASSESPTIPFLNYDQFVLQIAW